MANNNNNNNNNNGGNTRNQTNVARNNAPKAANVSANTAPAAKNNAPKNANTAPVARNNAPKASNLVAPPNATTSLVAKNNASNNSSKGALNSLKENTTLIQVLKLIAIAIVTFLIMYGIRWFIKSQQRAKIESPYIIRGSNSGKNSIVVSQNPAEDNSITLYRSDGEEGAEFTYTTWLLIQNMEYKNGEWKHIFHKGNKTSFPNRAPGVWIHPNNNALRIYMNTYENPLEYIDIDNVPVRKWFHLGISLNHKYLDIYFNGQLRKRKELDSLPRQNYGDLWCSLYGGFEGYISKLQYHRRALDYKEVEDIVRQGPSKDACGDTGEYPPYLDDSWWYDI